MLCIYAKDSDESTHQNYRRKIYGKKHNTELMNEFLFERSTHAILFTIIGIYVIDDFFFI